jgi:uncharacterized repeat protein (TIGR03803 family)
LAQGRDGQLYGTTSSGGAYNPPDGDGVVFRLNTNGTETILHSFSGADGNAPEGGLTLGSDGNFYGTTARGGSFNLGVLFSITPTGKFTVLYNFTPDSYGFPDCPPVEGLNGDFYGTAQGNESGGEVYKYSRTTGFTVIHDFTNTGLSTPISCVIFAADGTLYGTVNDGGTNGYGAVFKMTTAGAVERVFSLNVTTTGAYPEWPLIQASDGSFFGVTEGVYNGSVFRITEGGTLSVFYYGQQGTGELTDTTGGVVQGTDGNLYGSALSGGDNDGGIYQLTLDGAYADVYNFSKDQQPEAAMMQHTDGKFYGTTYTSTTGGYGSVYSFDMGLGPFIALVRNQGGVGSVAQILGQGLTGSTGVTFNGIASTNFEVVSDTYMTAAVPTGATTGAVVVTTPAGTLTSNRDFLVLP